MIDPLKQRLANLQKFSDSARRRANLYTDIVNIDGSTTAKSLGVLQKASAPGKKLQKIGFLMLWIPEPTGVTCAIGAPMIIAGRYLDKNTMDPPSMILDIILKAIFQQLLISRIL